MATLFEKLPMLLGSPRELEDLLERLSEAAPPPPMDQVRSFFQPVVDQGQQPTTRSPEDLVALAASGVLNSGTQGIDSFAPDQEADKARQDAVMAGLAQQFLGAKEPEPFQSHFAPMPGTVRASGGAPGAPARSQVLSSVAQGAAPSPLDSLADLIMRGAR